MTTQERAPLSSCLRRQTVWPDCLAQRHGERRGSASVDRYNPNPARRTTPICGLQVIGDVQKLPEGTWDQGWIYDPKTGSSYNVTLTLQGPDQLKVTGYKGIKLLSKSFIWNRAPLDLPRCDAAESGSAKAARAAVVNPSPGRLASSLRRNPRNSKRRSEGRCGVCHFIEVDERLLADALPLSSSLTAAFSCSLCVRRTANSTARSTTTDRWRSSVTM